MHNDREDDERRQRDVLADQLREQRDGIMTATQRREAVQIVQQDVRRQAARMGKTVSDDTLHRVGELADERMRREPYTIDQVRATEAQRAKEAERDGGTELRGIAAEVRQERTAEHLDRRTHHHAKMQHLRQQTQQAQEHQRAGRERERTR